MKSINDIFSEFDLNDQDVAKLSAEAKFFAVDCGRKGVKKELDSKSWDLFYDISDKLWTSSIANVQKIELGFKLYELFPSYWHFLLPFYNAISNGEIVEENEKSLIWKQFMAYLSSENYYADPVGYVLWVEFFENESTVKESWQGLVSNDTFKVSLYRLLEHSGPVPFDLKESLYNNLINDKNSHEFIFKSLLYSAYDVFGKIDKERAVKMLARLKIDKDTENYGLLQEKLK